jgi:ribosomal protein S12 methylthiotransferase
MRGKLDSRAAGDVLSEAERLVDSGVKELLVISQDTSAYGVDLKYRLGFWGGRPVKTRITELCRELGSLGAWVRLHYVYPYPHVDELIPLMAEGLVLPYLDVPLQHGSPRILKLMKRPAATENALQRIRQWREICPDITLRSTFIVGFPGETDDDFKRLLDFIIAAQLDRVGCFQYSPVKGARANDLAGHVPGDVMAEREQAFMQLQAEISRNRLKAKVGSVQQVLVDGVDEHGAIARSFADAPEIDGQVDVLDGQHLQAGDLVNIKITDADDYDLSGYLCN